MEKTGDEPPNYPANFPDILVVSAWDLTELGLLIALVFGLYYVSVGRYSIFQIKGEEIEAGVSENRNLFEFLKKSPGLASSAGVFLSILLCLIIAFLLADLFTPGSGVDVLNGNSFLIGICSAFVLSLIGDVFPISRITGDIIPKLISYAITFRWFTIITYPVAWPLMKLAELVKRIIPDKKGKDTEEVFEEALETSTGELPTYEDKKILKGVLNFGNIYVKQIMRPRTDIIAFDLNMPFRDVVKAINENQYSRVPVFHESIDRIEGILYIKDLIPYLGGKNDFAWQKLLRPAFYVHESKKIDSLLQEFKQKKVHLAIVIDEYGGSSGLITLEDIVEEIVGEIHDEFDEDDVVFSRLDQDNVVFDGKTNLNDVIRLMDIDDGLLTDVKGEAETIGGLIIEMCGKIPSKGHKIDIQNYRFTVDLVDRKRIRRVKVSRLQLA